jgi:hypothetical protein
VIYAKRIRARNVSHNEERTKHGDVNASASAIFEEKASMPNSLDINSFSD